MDELDLLARMRADVPPPEELTLRRARRTLLDRAAAAHDVVPFDAEPDAAPGPLSVDTLHTRGSPGFLRRRPAAVRFAAAAAAAVALVGGGAVLTGGEQSYGIGATPAAAEVLNRAADSALRRPAPATTPRSDQYVYRREVGSGRMGSIVLDRTVPDPEHSCGAVHELWIPVDPDRRTIIRRTDGVLLPPGGAGDPTTMRRDPLCDYSTFTADGGIPSEDEYLGPDAVRRLPTDPEALYAHARRQVADASLVDDATLAELLGYGWMDSPWITPELHAAIFRAVAYVPGVELLGSGTDLLGRPGTVIGRTEPGRGTRQEIVFDPGTGRVLGSRETIVDPQRAAGQPTCAPGASCPTVSLANPMPAPGTVTGQSVVTMTVVDPPVPHLDGRSPKNGEMNDN